MRLNRADINSISGGKLSVFQFEFLILFDSYENKSQNYASE